MRAVKRKHSGGNNKVSPLKLKLSSTVVRAKAPLSSPSPRRKRSIPSSPVRDVPSNAPVLGSSRSSGRKPSRSRTSPSQDSASSKRRPPTSVHVRDNFNSPVRHSSSDENPRYESSDHEGSVVHYNSGDNEYSSAASNPSDRQSPHPPLNVHVNLTDGYDSDLLTQHSTVPTASTSKRPKIDFRKVAHLGQRNKPGDAIDPELAAILQSNWRSASGKSEDSTIRVALDELYKKYQIPDNCPFLHPPQTNKEIRKLLKATQRSADVKYVSMQKSLGKTMSGILMLLEEAQKDTPDFVMMGQITADMGAILGDVSHEINKKRRSYVRGSLKYDYKDLCNNRESESFLFGDNLSQDIVDLSASKRLKYEFSTKGTRSSPAKTDNSRHSRYYKSKSSGSYSSTARKSFLGESKRSVNPPYRKNGAGKRKK